MHVAEGLQKPAVTCLAEIRTLHFHVPNTHTPPNTCTFFQKLPYSNLVDSLKESLLVWILNVGVAQSLRIKPITGVFLYRGLNNWNSVLEPYTKTRVPFKGFLKGVYKGSIIKGFYNIGALIVRILAPNVL